MPLLSRRSRATTIALVGLLALTACTASTPETARPTALKTSDPDAALTVIDAANEREASVATSAELFDSSPVVVVAPSGDPKAQELAARAAIGLGVPLLVGKSDVTESTSATTETPAPTASAEPTPDGLPAELKRLKATTALVIGAVESLDAEAEDSESDLTVERVTASASAVTEATGLKLGAATAED